MAPAADIQKAQRLLRDANVTANSSKKLVHRVRSKLQTPKSYITITTVIDHVDSVDARSSGVLKALLEVLKSQVSPERFQAVQHRLLGIAARRGHHEILEHLRTSSVSSDYSLGETLETAVLFCHVSCVKILLESTPSIHNIERALLATDFIELKEAREISRLLLLLKIPHSILDYLRLKMYAASVDDFDLDTLHMLVEAGSRKSFQAEIGMEMDFTSLYAYFEVQKQVRMTFTRKRMPSSSSFSTTSAQATEGRSPKRNFFGDETIESPENLVVRLLERYITNCTTKEVGYSQWSLYTIDLFLDKLPHGAEELPEYARSLLLAASFQQTLVFTRMLHHRPLSTRALRSLPLHAIVRSTELMIALVDCLNKYCTSDKDYLEVVGPLLTHACESQLLPSAVQICSRSRVHVSISPVLQYLRIAIESEQHIEDLSDLLKVAKVDECDLDLLWEHVLASVNFPTNAARILLQAGYKSAVIAKTFLRCVRFDEEISNLSMILDEWQVPETLSSRAEFDYSTSTEAPKLTCQADTIKLECQYFDTLGTALSIAIVRQQIDLCRLLLDKGAPLVLAGQSLLELAVRRGSKHHSLEEDKILDLILNYEKESRDAQMVLNYALVQAIKHQRAQVVSDFLYEGASTIAYNFECWQIVFRHKQQATLRSLLATPQASLELSKNFMAIFASFDIDPRTWLTLSDQLHQAGYLNSRCYSWVLSVLCLCNKATVQSAEQLLAFGASTRDELDQCLEHCWHHGNLAVFRVLIKKGVSQSTAESLFQAMIQNITASTSAANGEALERIRATMVPGAMSLLLEQNIPQRLIDTALCSVAVSYRTPVSLRVSVLKSLLEKEARFSEDNGLALVHCLLVDDKALMAHINASRPSLKARQAALRFALHFPDGMGDPAPSCRFHAVAQLLYPLPPTPTIKLTEKSVIDITGIFLSPQANTPTTLIHHFYGWLRNQTPSGLSDLEHCWTLEKKLNALVEGLVGTKARPVHFIERITAVLAWTRPEPESAITSTEYSSSFWLPRASLSRYLLESSKAGLTPIVGALLEAGVSPNVFDENGRSALSWASGNNEPDVVLLLTNAGADLDDGSLHEALCHQHNAIVRLLLKSGHGRMRTSCLHDDMTPLLAFIQFDHIASKVKHFPYTINTFMIDQEPTPELCKDLKAAAEAAISHTYAFKLILALIPWLRHCFDAQRAIFESPIPRGPLRYSLLSLIDRWEYSCLNRGQRNSLVLFLQGIGFVETFYTVDGDQPGNAVNVPEAILLAEETRKRQAAFETKECCIHGERAESETEIRAGLMPSCAASHGWKGDIVCTDCLKQYLESRMFPHDDVSIKYKFPATKIPCWAPKCPSTELTYNVLREHTDPEIFRLYDLALCQALLREGKSMVKCATTECPGAHWYDENDEHDNLKIFFCEICFQNTCTECNDLYEKHDGRPCPAGEEARKCERIKEEEKLSEEALKREKKCPKCKLMYQKYYGCDHIVCGKNVYDNKVDSK